MPIFINNAAAMFSGPGPTNKALSGLRPWLTGKAWHKQTLPFSFYLYTVSKCLAETNSAKANAVV